MPLSPAQSVLIVYALNRMRLSSYDSADEVTRYIYVSADCESSAAFEEIQKAGDRLCVLGRVKQGRGLAVDLFIEVFW